MISLPLALNLRVRGLVPLFKCLLLFVALTANSALAEVRDRLTVTYYTIDVLPGKSLLSQINAASKIREDGQIYHGFTKWNIDWSVRWNTDSQGVCRIVSSMTQLDVQMTLPSAKRLNPQQAKVFSTYSQALRMHEQGHYELARQGAFDIDQALLTLPGTNDCKALEGLASAKVKEGMARLNERSKQYDRSTAHGKTQGALLDDKQE